jgi:hypothetical protein
MKLRYILIFLLAVTTAQAQVPGFLGKRFTVFIDGNPMPSVFAQNMNNYLVLNPGGDAQAAGTRFLAYNLRPQVTAEFLVGHRFSVGVSYSRILIGTSHGYYTQNPSDIDDYVANNNYLFDPDVIKGQSAGLHFKLFETGKSASVAPIGFYTELSVYLTQTNTYDDRKATTRQFRDDFVYPVVSIGSGRQSMIARNLLLKAGVEFGWAFVPGNFLMESRDEWNAEEYSGYSVHKSLFGYHLMNVKLGVGYILF